MGVKERINEAERRNRKEWRNRAKKEEGNLEEKYG